ncbi:MAG: shikimate dehydrogenase [Dehalococcoidia bacterium]
MKRVGLIGYPLGHSISPALHQAAFAALGIEGRYETWETPPEALADRVNALRSEDVLGANVTIPHKEAVIELLDGTTDLAAKSGAVNTIVNRAGRLSGHNTDVIGFARALREDAGFDARGARAAVLGAGGAGRAVALALLEARASLTFVADIVPQRAEALVESLRPLAAGGSTLVWGYWASPAFRQTLAGCQLLVNCTPVGTRGGDSEGQSPLSTDLIPKDVLVFDLVYNPPETPLMAAARERGCRVSSGLGMLVYQAAESFRLWTGRKPPMESMLQAGRRALEVFAGQAGR